MELTWRVMTNVEKPEGSKAPMGQFARLRNEPRERVQRAGVGRGDRVVIDGRRGCSLHLDLGP